MRSPLLFLVVSLVACGGSESGGAESSESTSPSPAEESASATGGSEDEGLADDYGEGTDTENVHRAGESCEEFCQRRSGDPDCYGNVCNGCVDECAEVQSGGEGGVYYAPDQTQ